MKSFRFWPVSLTHLVLLFVCLLTLLFVLLGWFTMQRMQQIHREVERGELAKARREVAEAVQRVEKTAQDEAERLATWDGFGRGDRTAASDGSWYDRLASLATRLPASVLQVRFYDPQGRALSVEATGSPPAIIPADFPALERQAGGLLLWALAPLPGYGSSSTPLGYVAVAVDFLRSLKELNRFSATATDSIGVAVAPGAWLRQREIMPRMHFRARPVVEFQRIEMLVRRSLTLFGGLLVLLSSIFYLVVYAFAIRPAFRLSRHIDRMRLPHADEQPLRQRGILPVREFEEVHLSLRNYQRQLDQVHERLDEQNHELWELAHRDSLTNVLNRRAFDQEWEHILGTARPAELVCMLFDCDHFKAINDTYGHEVGDHLLRDLARALASGLCEQGKLYRLGGDEFATLLVACSPAAAQQVAERCVQAVKASDFHALGVVEPVRVSIGMAYADSADADQLEQLRRRADIAMYQAKRPGHSQIVRYSSGMGDPAEAVVSSQITTSLYQAFDDPGMLELHYQPVVDMATGKRLYYEALSRVRAASELIGPEDFLPVVETRRLEVDFDLLVLERLRHDLATQELLSGAGAAVNLFAPSLVHSEVIEVLLGIAREYAGRCRLVVEVTETALITHLGKAVRNLERLREAGFTIALDDFGNGYSSLRYLADVPVDVIKFDIDLIRSLQRSDRQSHIVASMASMLSSAGYRLVAEGIESREMLHKVAYLGFDCVQGTYCDANSESMADFASALAPSSVVSAEFS